MIVHSECGGELIIDTAAKSETVTDEHGTFIYRGVKCKECGAVVGMLANISSEEVNTYVQ